MSFRLSPFDNLPVEPIATAPRNGLSIIVGDEDVGQFVMHWSPTGENPIAQPGMGIWETWDRSFTWSEHDGMGPTYWRALEPLDPGEFAPDANTTRPRATDGQP